MIQVENSFLFQVNNLINKLMYLKDNNINIKNNKRLKAFSLIEVMFYISMLSVFILVLATFWGTLMEVQEKGRAMSAVDSEALFILEQISESIRSAEGISSPLNGNSSSTLSLSFKDTSRDPTIFNLLNGDIQLSQAGGGYISLNSDRVVINNIIFTNLTRPSSKGTIKIQLDLSYINPNGSANSNYSQTYYAGASLR